MVFWNFVDVFRPFLVPSIPYATMSHAPAILGRVRHHRDARQVRPVNLAVQGFEKLGKCDGRRHRSCTFIWTLGRGALDLFW